MRNPVPGEWRSEVVSKNHIADYKPFMFVDGEGVRCSLYLSGCLFACEGCFNEAAWSFRYGTPYGPELEEKILADLAHESVQGLSLLGGEPFLNTEVALSLVRRLRKAFGSQKDVWSWTGYTFEELLVETPDKQELLREVDVLVDGRFDLQQKDLRLQFRGSRNQRLVDVKASFAAGEVVLWQSSRDADTVYEQINRRELI